MTSGANSATLHGLFNSKGLANLFLDWAAECAQPITPLKLQKLLYFCHADYLVSYNVPLLEDEFEAWSYGPVLPMVYHEFKDFGTRPITGRATDFDPINCSSYIPTVDPTNEHLLMIRQLFLIYVPVRAEYLSHISHHPDGPWARALGSFRKHQNLGRRISSATILKAHKRAMV